MWKADEMKQPFKLLASSRAKEGPSDCACKAEGRAARRHVLRGAHARGHRRQGVCVPRRWHARISPQGNHQALTRGRFRQARLARRRPLWCALAPVHNHLSACACSNACHPAVPSVYITLSFFGFYLFISIFIYLIFRVLGLG